MTDYRGLLGSLTAPADSAGDPLDNAMRREGSQRAAIAVRDATNPDAAGRANAIARRTGAAPSTIERNLPAYEAGERARLAREAAEKYPELAGWMQNPRNAAVGADDMDDLGRNAARWRAMQPFGVKATPETDGTFWNGVKGIGTSLYEGVASLGAQVRGFAGDWLPGNMTPAAAPGIPRLADAGAENDRRQRAQSAERVNAATPAYRGTLKQSLYGGFSSIAQTAPVVALGVLSGSAPVSLIGMGLQSGVPAYNKYRDRGATRSQALMGGALEGGIEAGTEAIPMGYLVGKLGKKGAGHFVAGFLGRELPGEVAATIGQNAVDTAIANPDKTWGQFLREQPDAIVQTAIGTLMTAGLYGGVHHAVRRYAGDAVEATRATGAADALDQAMAGAAESKTRQRDKEAYSELVKLHTQDTPSANIFIPAGGNRCFFTPCNRLP